MGGRPGRRRRSRERILAKLPDLGQVLRGSLVERYRRCGKPGCHCAREGDPGHGPAHYLMVTVARGKTVTVYVPERDVAKVEVYLANFRRARVVLEEVSTENRLRLKEGRLFTGG